MASMTTVKCACCKKEFQARTADVARGWGKFCSKRCKAIDQTGRKVPANHPASRWETDQEMHDQAMHDSTQGWDEGGWLNC